MVAEFAEQFSIDVSMVTDTQCAALTGALGREAFGAVLQMYVADFLPRVRAGLTALGLPVELISSEPRWDSDTDASDVVFNHLLPGIARLRTLDPVTTEVVRLRGAVAHDCRLCKSLRDSTALGAGGSESLYDDIEIYEESGLLSDGHKAALRYVDALVWSPAHITPEIAGGVRKYFTANQARELTLDVMRNASNKIAVALRRCTTSTPTGSRSTPDGGRQALRSGNRLSRLRLTRRVLGCGAGWNAGAGISRMGGSEDVRWLHDGVLPAGS